MRACDLSLWHFTREALGALKRREPGVDPHWKPNGLWVSVDGADDWLSFGRHSGLEEFQTPYPHQYRVVLHTDCRVALLESLEDMETFTELYPGWRPYENSKVWQRVAEDWDGILVAPFQPWANHSSASFDWYTAWDCASGCIWQPRAIQYIEEIPVRH